MEKEDYTHLIKKFKEISEKGFIKGVNNLNNGVGLTFEEQLGKKADSEFFPDYKGIEIKCSQRFSRYSISLFTLAFDGPSVYEMNRLLEKYGKFDYQYVNAKTLIVNLKINNYVLFNDKYYFKLYVDYEKERLSLAVYDLEYNLLDEASYIDFSSLKSRLEVKLSKMALIYASKKVINDANHFRYYKINIYQLKSFERFIKLIEEDIVKITLLGRISRCGEREGRTRNKNMLFQISKLKLDELFYNIYSYNTDENKNSSNFMIFR